MSAFKGAVAVSAIARVTFRELVRDRIFYGAVVVGVFLLFVSTLLSKLSFTRSDRILMDFGLSSVQVAQAFLGAFLAAPLLAREIQRRTIQMVLSRPVSYVQFVTGKFLGLCAVLFLNTLLLGLVIAAILALSDGADFVTGSYWLALLGAFLQSALLASIAIFLSSFSTTGLSAILSMGVYLIGQNISQFDYLATKAATAGSRLLWKGLAQLTPQFESLTLGFHATYGLPAPSEFFLGLFYVAVWAGLMIPCAGFLLKRREMG